MRISRSGVLRLPIFVFVLAVLVTTSTVAAAGYFRVAMGLNGISNGGGGFGCAHASAGYFCSAPESSDIQNWNNLRVTVNYQNSNKTQPAYACWAYPNSTGGGCATSTTNNCPFAGVCSYLVDINGWSLNNQAYKFLEFTNLPSGVVIAGYTITY
jgi:hypothetical protein